MSELELHPSPLAQLKLNGNATTVPLDKIGNASEAALSLTEEQRSQMDHAHSCGSPDGPDLELLAYRDDPQRIADMLTITPEEASIILVNMDTIQRGIEEGLVGGVMASSNSYWPGGCHGNDYHKYTVFYWVDDDSFPERFYSATTQEEIRLLDDVGVWGPGEMLFDLHLGKPMFHVAKWLLEQSYARHGLNMVEKADKDDTVDITITGAILSNGWLGFGEFPQGRCNHVSGIRLRKNSNYDPGLHRFDWLLRHEVGHAVGLGHTRSQECAWKDIMSYCNATPAVGFYNPETMSVPASLLNGRRKDRSIVTLDKLYEGTDIRNVITPPTVRPIIPGFFTGNKLADGTYEVRGEVTIPKEAAGGTYIMERMGGEPRHRLIPKAVV